MREDIFNYEYAVEQTLKFFDFLVKKKNFLEAFIRYECSHYTYFKESSNNQPDISLKNIKGCNNTSIQFSNYYDVNNREKPFIFHLWKYLSNFSKKTSKNIEKCEDDETDYSECLQKHIFLDIDLAKEELDESNFENLYQQVVDFFDLKSSSEQLRLF